MRATMKLNILSLSTSSSDFTSSDFLPLKRSLKSGVSVERSLRAGESGFKFTTIFRRPST